MKKGGLGGVDDGIFVWFWGLIDPGKWREVEEGIRKGGGFYRGSLAGSPFEAVAGASHLEGGIRFWKRRGGGARRKLAEALRRIRIQRQPDWACLRTIRRLGQAGGPVHISYSEISNPFTNIKFGFWTTLYVSF